MEKLKNILKKTPVIKGVYKRLRERFHRYRLKRKSTEEIFKEIYHANAWGGSASVSGWGSDKDQTTKIRHQLPILFKEFGISTVLDIPCGDFHWMKEVDLRGVEYIGADIVPELVDKNQTQYGDENITFLQKNIIEDELPQVDLMLCRDCLVHFSDQDIFSSLKNFLDSGSEYLLTTTFTDRKRNDDIATGQWRPLNLEKAPFFLPEPRFLINEECIEKGGVFEDKALGLWRDIDVRQGLKTTSQ